MKYVIRRQRANGRQEWFRYGRTSEQWMRTRASAHEFTTFHLAHRIAAKWAVRGNNWTYWVDSTEETRIHG